MKTKRELIHLVIICLLMFSLNIGVSASLTNAAEVKEVLIGTLFATSGPLAPSGIEFNNIISMAAEEINESGGIKSLGGAKLKIVKGDDEGKPEVAISEAEKLARMGVVAIIGGFQSASAFTATSATEKNKVSFITQGVADNITERGFRYVFRPHVKAAQLGKLLADYMLYLNKVAGTKRDKVAILYEDTLYGQTTAKSLQKHGPEAGLKIAADLPYPSNSADLTSIITKLKYAEPNFAVAISYISDAILIVKGINDRQMDLDAFIGIGLGYSRSEFLGLGKMTQYVMNMDSSYSDLKINGLAEMGDRFYKKFKKGLDGGLVNHYSYTYLLKDALERAGSIEREKVRDALAASDIRPGERGNVTIGHFKFDNTGQCEYEQMVKQVFINESGSPYYKSVYPEELAPGKVVFPAPKWKDRK